ncbi:DNA polymerase [Mesoflavibacter zeaxanthinifaciens]|uniref:DNA polymerase n=1 Tax=Flavobacteriaceae TaxID=49546 RepID=UPI003A93E341
MSRFVICLTENTWYSLDIDNEKFIEGIALNSKSTYITFQVSDFIRYIKSKDKKYIPDIINLESLDKQFSQSGKELLGYGKWHILKSLRREEFIKSDYRVSNIESFLQTIKDFYSKITEGNADEFQRFNEIEKKVNKIIHKTALQGIRVDLETVKQRCEELHRYLYQLKNKFQFEHSIFQPENTETQLQYLKSKKYKILNSCKRTISLLKSTDEICNLFYEINRTAQDLKSLIYMTANFGGKEFIHPYFLGFGTITSRIVIKEPALQNLRKKNRDIIIPNTGKKLLYIDYSQYEAGILAHCSGDEKLLNLYNEKDIYSDIVQNVLKEDNPERRKESKVLFYRYLYGDDFSSNVKLKNTIEAYFGNFIALSKFKKQLIEESKKDGFVKSIKGNHRVLNVETDNVWILSHYIQSIASYIFKKALIEVNEKVKEAKLLIPLHDGALYEVNEESFDDLEKQIREIFINNLKLECPKLKNASAEVKDFCS